MGRINQINEQFNLSPQEREELIKDLFAKHGSVPLIQLIRHLIIALDQTQPGTEHRLQTFELLKVLSQQDTISSNSSHWLDWLDTSGDGLTWESLMSSEKQKKSFGQILPRLTVSDAKNAPPAPNTESPIQPTSLKPKSAAPRRMSVEEPDEVPNKTRPRPLTKEQQIWDEALRRNEAKKNRMSKQWLTVIFALIVFSLGYLGVQKRHLLNEVVQKTLYNPKNVVLMSGIGPELFWGTYRPTRNPMESSKWLPFLQQEGSLKTLGIETWLREGTGVAQNNVLQLLIQEQTFFDSTSPLYSTNFDLRSFPTGTKEWNIERTEADGRIRTFMQSQTISFENNKLELSLKRACGSDGIAHRIILGTQGLLAWSWRLRLQDQTIDGQVVRQVNPSRMNILITLPNQQKISHSCAISNGAVIFPAVWTPALAAFSEFPVLHPISGLLCSKNTFETDLDVKKNDLKISLKDIQNHWQEVWEEIPTPNLNR